MNFKPDEVLFLPTTLCNLRCHHCLTRQSPVTISRKASKNFLAKCARAGIRRVGFTGGEPFLVLDFLKGLVKTAVAKKMIFDQIVTNSAWFGSKKELTRALRELKGSGYDGSICVSVDAFHKCSLRKVALFIKTAVAIWERPDMVSIAYISGARDSGTLSRLSRLSVMLDSRLARFGRSGSCMRGKYLFIKLLRITLSPIGTAARLKSGWDGRWFTEDRCEGPGNIFFVMPDGSVKPCCGYAAILAEFTIGNIMRDSVARLIGNARANRFISTVFFSGLGTIRRRLESRGIVFPGKSTNHCFFCHYILTNVPRAVLDKCLD